MKLLNDIMLELLKFNTRKLKKWELFGILIQISRGLFQVVKLVISESITGLSMLKAVVIEYNWNSTSSLMEYWNITFKHESRIPMPQLNSWRGIYRYHIQIIMSYFYV